MSVIYIHTVELSAKRGPYVDSAEIGIEFPSVARVFGQISEAPAGAHISCKDAVDGMLSCRISPLDADKDSRSSARHFESRVAPNYRLTAATDQREQPVIHIEGRNVRLVEGLGSLEANPGIGVMVLIGLLAAVLWSLVREILPYLFKQRQIKPTEGPSGTIPLNPPPTTESSNPEGNGT